MIRVKKLHPKAKLPTRKGDVNKSAYTDISVAWVEVKQGTSTTTHSEGQVAYSKGDTVVIHTGLAMELPKGTYGELLPRSSTFKKTGLILTNGAGIIDHDYCGNADEWMAMMYATRDGIITIGEDYLQFRVVDNPKEIKIKEVDNLSSVSRGSYGSTDTMTTTKADDKEWLTLASEYESYLYAILDSLSDIEEINKKMRKLPEYKTTSVEATRKDIASLIGTVNRKMIQLGLI